MNDDHDHLVELDLGFDLEMGAPSPLVIQDEGWFFVMFYAYRGAASEGTYTEGIGVVEIKHCGASKFGYPNDEALAGHPLYERGLRFYSAFEVLNSSWIARLAARNRVSFPNYDAFARDRHFILTFHDSTLECIGRDLIATFHPKAYLTVLREIVERVSQTAGEFIRLYPPPPGIPSVHRREEDEPSSA